MLILTTALLLILYILTASLYFISLIKAPDFKQVDGYRILALSIYRTCYKRVKLIYT